MTTPVISEHTHVIVVGNEKGGAGKTTTSMHLIVSLLNLGFSVGTVDLDSRQRSLTRYIENRRETATSKGLDIPMPSHAVVKKSPFNIAEEAQSDEKLRLEDCLRKLSENADFIVIDTPGSDSFMSRTAHSYADTIVTPINDSFLDLDVLAKIEKDELNVERPGIYSEMIWEQKIARARRNRGSIDWVVVRNRLSTIDAHNKRNMATALQKLSKRIGFRTAAGFGERVIFRELFLHGLTLIDITDAASPIAMSLSHVAARQELREFLEALKIAKLSERLSSKQAAQQPQPVQTQAVSDSNTAIA